MECQKEAAAIKFGAAAGLWEDGALDNPKPPRPARAVSLKKSGFSKSFARTEKRGGSPHRRLAPCVLENGLFYFASKHCRGLDGQLSWVSPSAQSRCTLAIYKSSCPSSKASRAPDMRS